MCVCVCGCCVCVAQYVCAVCVSVCVRCGVVLMLPIQGSVRVHRVCVCVCVWNGMYACAVVLMPY